MVVVAGIAAAGVMVGSLPSPRRRGHPTRAGARLAITDAQRLVAEVEDQVDGRDLVARAPEQAKTVLDEAFGAVERAAGAGVAAAELEPLRARVDRGLDALYHVTRIGDIAIVANLASTLEAVRATRMVASSDGALWLADEGRGRVIRVDPADGSVTVVYRAGQELAGGVAAAPGFSPRPPPTSSSSTARGRRGGST